MKKFVVESSYPKFLFAIFINVAVTKEELESFGTGGGF